MRRNIHCLVKNSGSIKSSKGLFQPTRDTIPATGQSMGDGDKTPGKPGKPTSHLEDYVKSYGDGDFQTGTTVHDIESLVEDSQEVWIKDEFGWSLLHYAAHSRPIETVKRLLSLHADPNVTNCLGRSPLHQAVMRDEAEIVTELLTYGANPNLPDSDGWTPVHFAVHLGNLKALTALAPYQPDFSQKNKSDRSARDLAHSAAVSDLIQLLEAGAGDYCSPSLDSTGFSDSGSADHHHDQSNPSKLDTKQRFALRESSHTIVRAQRPNEESGAIVSPHPNSAYS